MEKYKKRFAEIKEAASIRIVNSNCNDLKDIKSIILKEYKKVSSDGKTAEFLKPYNTVPYRYSLIPEGAKEKEDEIKQALGGGKGFSGIIWDTVDVTYSFEDKMLTLTFNGYKLNKTVEVHY